MEDFRRIVREMLPGWVVTRKLKKGASNCVLLTFDDGPHPEITPIVLDKLEAHGVVSVFFVVGRRIEKAPHILKRIQERGHIIGNHSYVHTGQHLGYRAYKEDIERAQLLIEKFTGESPRFFRPPAGKISLRSLLIPFVLGLKTVTWSLSVSDWRYRSEEDTFIAAERIIRTVSSRDIILLHDDNQGVLSILDQILPKLRKYDLASGVKFLLGEDLV